MIEQVEDQSLEEPLELKGTEYEFSKCKKLKIKYTKALLLEFNEVEVCRKLPRDFDLLILRCQLDGESDGKIEQKSICGNSSGHNPLPRTRWNLDFPGERWDNHLLTPSKESHSQRNCGLERRHAVCQQLPQKGYDAGILGQNPSKSDLFQLTKSENPYRPPHFNNKTLQPLANFSESGVESAGESDQRVSADSITGNEKSTYEIPLSVVVDSTKNPVSELENSSRNNERNQVIGANETLGEIMEDDQLTFDDFWAETLEILHLQQEFNISPTNSHADTYDSEVEIHFPDEDSLISVGHLTRPETFDFIDLENSDDSNSEAEINLPDEDSLISINDMIAPYRSVPTFNSDPLEVNKVTSNMAVNIRKNSESLNVTKSGDQSTSLSCKAQSFSHSSGLVTHGKLHSLLSHSQTSTVIFGPNTTSPHLGKDHVNFPPKFATPNIFPYIPTLNCFTRFHSRSCQEITLTKTKTNDSFVKYPMLEQPNIFPDHQNHLLVGTSCHNPMKQAATPDLNAMQFLPSTSQQPTYQGFGKSHAVALDPISRRC